MIDPSKIEIKVQTKYVVEQSAPDEDRYVFAYAIRIFHHGGEPCQLLSRHWVITDGAGEVEEVRGEGVVGKQPRLVDGETFEYTSGAILKTPVGTMQGSYRFKSDNGQTFDVPIDVFSLNVPHLVH